MATMKSVCFRQRNTLQLSYKLPHYIHASAVYPVRSPNGSRIIIYGHEQGLRIIWYGGRPYKKPASSNASAKVNGTSKDEPMVIDLSDDDEPAPSATEAAEFEEKDDEVDPAEPYRDVLRYIDIELATSATHIAVPYVSPVQDSSPSDSHASLLSSHLVVAVACADVTIRLISLPLAPPAQSSNEPQTWGMQVVQIPASGGHQDFITSIAITDFAEEHVDEAGGDRNKSRSRSGARIASKSSKPRTGPEWSFLIASTSCTGSGLLLIHRINLTDENTFDQSSDGVFPAQRQLLRSPLCACRLSFNPCPHPADRASDLLITLPDSGCVKVYQVIPQSSHARGRTGSGATIESTTSSAGSARGSSKQQGKFLVTLYSAFLAPSESQPFGRRKRPLAASWVLGGRAILALFENGDWGIWDLEAAGPPSAAQNQNLLQGQSSVSGVQGGAQAAFTIKGSIVPHKSASENTTIVKANSSDTGALAPMTPHTRKTRSDRLFEGREADSMALTEKVALSRGSIGITELPQTSVTQSSKFTDESVLLTYGESSHHLPSLLTFWRSEVSGKRTFGASSVLKPNLLAPLRLGGQPIKSIFQLPIEPAGSATEGILTIPEILAATDHTLVLLLSPLAEESTPQEESKHSFAARLPGTSTNTNELLLERGELGIDGLDHMLNDMTNGNARDPSKTVGFDVDEDMDIGMRTSIGTPTPKLAGRLRPARGTPNASFRPGKSKVRLFS